MAPAKKTYSIVFCRTTRSVAKRRVRASSRAEAEEKARAYAEEHAADLESGKVDPFDDMWEVTDAGLAGRHDRGELIPE